MSPVARSRARTGHTGRAVAVAAAGVLLAVGLVFGVSVLANQGSVDVRLGDDTFVVDEAEARARTIADRGPILFPDLVGGTRDIYLQHLGAAPLRDWFAFEARPASAPRECTVQWEPDPGGGRGDGVFRLLDRDGEVTDACDGEEFRADGTGLPQHRVEIIDGDLVIDLNLAERTSPTDG